MTPFHTEARGSGGVLRETRIRVGHDRARHGHRLEGDARFLRLGFVEAETAVPFDETRLIPPAERDAPCNALIEN